MKYLYYRDCASYDSIISDYKITNGKIVIMYLDGTNSEMILTEVNEQHVLELMLEQSNTKKVSLPIQAVQKAKNISLVANIINASAMTGFITLALVDYDTYGILPIVCSSVFCLSLVFNSVVYKLKTNELNELKKYDLYLSMKESLDSMVNYKVFKEEQRKGYYNIESLDSVSIDDINELSQQLEPCNEPIIIKKYKI